MSKSYQITTMQLGPMDNFVYIITDLESKKSAVVDPAWDTHKIMQHVQQHNSQIDEILLTHSHHDHINGVDEIVNQYDSQLHLLKAEAEFWQTDLDKPRLHAGGDRIQLGSTEITVLHTPGHTPGSACYLLDGDIITGDTLFVFGCGRCDLAGGDPEQMYTTLNKMKQQLDVNTRIHPGHNYANKKHSTISEQIEGNPFLHFHDCHDFVDYRMHRHDKIRSTPYQPVYTRDLLKP